MGLNPLLDRTLLRIAAAAPNMREILRKSMERVAKHAHPCLKVA
jgi:hypothetical protein